MGRKGCVDHRDRLGMRGPRDHPSERRKRTRGGGADRHEGQWRGHRGAFGEKGGAAAIAATLQESSKNKGLKVAVIASGGNVDRDVFAKILNGENFVD